MQIYHRLCYAQNRYPAQTGSKYVAQTGTLPKPGPSMYIILFLTKKILIEYYLSTQKNNEISNFNNNNRLLYLNRNIVILMQSLQCIYL